MGELKGFAGAFYFLSDAYTTVTDEALGNDAGPGTTFDLAHANPDYREFNLTIGGVRQNWPGDFSLSPAGKVTLVRSPGAAGAVVASYRYSTRQVEGGGFTGWSLQVSADVLDTTDFSSTGWRKKKAGLKGWSGSAERHWLTDSDMVGYLGGPVVAKFVMDDGTASDYYIGWGVVNGVNPRTAAQGLVDEPINFVGVDSLSKPPGT